MEPATVISLTTAYVSGALEGEVRPKTEDWSTDMLDVIESR